MFLSKLRARKEQEYLSHVSPEYLERLAKPEPISLQEYIDISCNSYERHLLYQKLSDEALLAAAKHTLLNSQFREIGKYELARSYDDALTGIFVPLLLARLDALISENAELRDRLESGGK